MQCRHPPQAQIRLSGSTTSSIRGRCFGREPRLIARGLAILFPVGASLHLSMDGSHGCFQSSSGQIELVGIGLLGFASEGGLLEGCDQLLKSLYPLVLRAMCSSLLAIAKSLDASRTGPQSASPSGQQRHREDRRQPTYPETTKSRPDLPSESVVLSHRAAAIRWSPAFSSGRHEPAANRGQRTAPRTGRGSESSGHPVCRAK